MRKIGINQRLGRMPWADFGHKHRVGESYEPEVAPTVMIDCAVSTIMVRLECSTRGFSLTSHESGSWWKLPFLEGVQHRKTPWAENLSTSKGPFVNTPQQIRCGNNRAKKCHQAPPRVNTAARNYENKVMKKPMKLETTSKVVDNLSFSARCFVDSMFSSGSFEYWWWNFIGFATLNKTQLIQTGISHNDGHTVKCKANSKSLYIAAYDWLRHLLNIEIN